MDSDVEEGEVRMAPKSHPWSQEEVKGAQGNRELEDSFEDQLNCAVSEEEGQILKKDMQPMKCDIPTEAFKTKQLKVIENKKVNKKTV